MKDIALYYIFGRQIFQAPLWKDIAGSKLWQSAASIHLPTLNLIENTCTSSFPCPIWTAVRIVFGPKVMKVWFHKTHVGEFRVGNGIFTYRTS